MGEAIAASVTTKDDVQLDSSMEDKVVVRRATRTVTSSSSQCSTMDAEDSEPEMETPPNDSSKPRVKGYVWTLTQDTKGCRLVQEALEKAVTEMERLEITRELHGHVAKAMRCPHANHVLQKCITTNAPEHSQFIIDEFLERDGLLAQAARHRYGCRIVQQLMRKCPSTQLQKLAELLLEDAILFCCHPFGNFVMRHLLEHGSAEHRHRLVRILERNASSVCRVAPGCNVVIAAFAHGAVDDRVWLARALLQEPGLLQTLAHMRSGNVVVTDILQVVASGEQQQARESLLQDLAGLRASKYGQHVAEFLDALQIPEAIA